MIPQSAPVSAPDSARSALPEDEEYSPFDAGDWDAPLLFVRVLDPALAPRRHFPVDVIGTSGRYAVVTDGDGVLFLDGCDPGAYVLSAFPKEGARSAPAHTLFHSDLREDSDPYVVIL